MNTLGTWSCCVAVVALLLSSFADLSVSQSVEQLFKMSADAYNEEKTKPVQMPAQNSSFDFIIVGGGPAGCTLARRLSENPNWSILLLEAGATESYLSDIPAMAAALQIPSETNWNYKTTPQKKACFGMRNNQCAVPQAKLLGGSTSIGFMIYSRGNKDDFNKLADEGMDDWSYKNVLPFFKLSEASRLNGSKDSTYHSTSGFQSVEHVQFRTCIADAFVGASKEAGYHEVDYNGFSQHGTSYVQAWTKNGHRQSAFKSALAPILETRKNLKVITFARATKVLIDKNKVAYGVQFLHRDTQYTLKAKKEVILSAGTFNSAQLLMMSGIGPKEHLNSVGIEPVVDLPVGQNLREHMAHLALVFTTNTSDATLFTNRITPDDMEGYQRGVPSTRLSTPSGVEAITYGKLPGSTDSRPDFELVFATASLASDFGTNLKESANYKDEMYEIYKPLENRDHFTLVVMPLHPKSVGNVSLQSSDPLAPVVINPNYFAADEDMEVMLSGTKEALRIINSPAMKRINATLYDRKIPGCEQYEFGNDDYWRCAIRTFCYTKHHHLGTCRMGNEHDSTTVVSPQLKVLNVKNLRVVDVSVMPYLPSAHVGAIPYMVAEKAADMIRKDWARENILTLKIRI